MKMGGTRNRRAFVTGCPRKAWPVLGHETPSSFTLHNNLSQCSHHCPFSKEKDKEPTSMAMGQKRGRDV